MRPSKPAFVKSGHIYTYTYQELIIVINSYVYGISFVKFGTSNYLISINLFLLDFSEFISWSNR